MSGPLSKNRLLNNKLNGQNILSIGYCNWLNVILIVVSHNSCILCSKALEEKKSVIIRAKGEQEAASLVNS